MMQVRVIIAVLAAAAAGLAQGPSVASMANVEQAELSSAVAEANGSPLDFIHALEKHLKKYPASAQRAQIEDTILKTAIDANENRWIAAYGEKSLARQVAPDLAVLDRVARALLDGGAPEPAARALAVASRYEATIQAMAKQRPEGHLTEGQWALEVEKGLSRALSLQSHALGNMGKFPDGAALALQAWSHWPSAEAAREAAHWLDQQDKATEAIAWYANAFAMDDPKTTPEQRTKDRMRLAELYRKAHGSEKGLGEVILAAYDSSTTSRTARVRAQLPKDPNIEAGVISDFRLASMGGAELSMKSLHGKTLVLDFWATWCVPCIAQHPMMERIKKKFADSKDLVFLALDSDEDRTVVPAFIQQQKWEGPVYFESGLARLLNIASLPTILVLDGQGRIISRMAGYIPEKFEAMLEQRILDTRESGIR